MSGTALSRIHRYVYDGAPLRLLLMGGFLNGETYMGKTVTAENVSAYFGSHRVLNEVSLTMQANQATAIIGPSGCGKSTFVRCINRMHETVPAAKMTGQLRLDGQDVYKMDPVTVRRNIGMVFQRPNPFPTLSIFDNVAVGLRLNGYAKRSVITDQVEKSLRMAALWDEVKDRLQKSSTGLSGGQQQRLCIARALAIEPDVLLMDEPASALDPISTLRIEELIEEIKQTYTIVIVTHNMQQAARVADTTAFFLSGEMVEHGPTTQIFTTPRDQRTEDYVTGRFG